MHRHRLRHADPTRSHNHPLHSEPDSYERDQESLHVQDRDANLSFGLSRNQIPFELEAGTNGRQDRLTNGFSCTL